MCVTSYLMSENKILVLKATMDNINCIIEKGSYELSNPPNDCSQFEKFVLVDEADSVETKVLAIGNINKISKINLSDNLVNTLNNKNCKWEFELSNVVDLRGDTLKLQDIFMSKKLDEINYTVQF